MLFDGVGGGLTAYLRVPAPRHFADVIAAAQAARTRLESLTLWFGREGSNSVCRVSREAVAADEAGFADRLAQAHLWRQNRRPVSVRVTAVRFATEDLEPFPTAAGARAARDAPAAVIVLYALALDAPMPGAAVEVRAGHLPVVLPAGWRSTRTSSTPRRPRTSSTLAAAARSW